MKLLLIRNKSDGDTTIGSLYVDKIFECDTLEDTIREVAGKPVSEWKIYGDTAIKAGTYNIVITHSPRFKKDLPLLEGVEGFSGIRIHAGNRATDTEGCILVGKRGSPRDLIGGSSRPALDRLQAKIKAALDAGQKVTITIKNPD
jgi:hypothetical protein